MVIGFTSVYLFTNHGMPFRPSTGLYPVLKEKDFCPLGTVYDVICLIAIMGAIITGFGFGVMQFSTGLAYNTGLEVNNLDVYYRSCNHFTDSLLLQRQRISERTGCT